MYWVWNHLNFLQVIKYSSVRDLSPLLPWLSDRWGKGREEALPSELFLCALAALLAALAWAGRLSREVSWFGLDFESSQTDTDLAFLSGIALAAALPCNNTIPHLNNIIHRQEIIWRQRFLLSDKYYFIKMKKTIEMMMTMMNNWTHNKTEWLHLVYCL